MCFTNTVKQNHKSKDKEDSIMINQNRESNQNVLQNDFSAPSTAAEDVQSASMTWDLISCNGGLDEAPFGDFFPMQAAG